MSKFEKAKERILGKPKDYTYTEAKAFLSQLGFEEYNKGKTSGSRVKFFRNLSGNPRLFNCRDESARKSEHMVAFAP